jgi:hypothetical protein
VRSEAVCLEYVGPARVRSWGMDGFMDRHRTRVGFPRGKSKPDGGRRILAPPPDREPSLAGGGHCNLDKAVAVSILGVQLWAGVRPGGWIGSVPGLKAGERAAERGFWGVGGDATGGSRAQREGPKS